MSLLGFPKDQFGKAFRIFSHDGKSLTEEARSICADIGFAEADLFARDITYFTGEMKEEHTNNGPNSIAAIHPNSEIADPARIAEMRLEHYEKRRQVKIMAIMQVVNMLRKIRHDEMRLQRQLDSINSKNVLDFKKSNDSGQKKDIHLTQIFGISDSNPLLSTIASSSHSPTITQRSGHGIYQSPRQGGSPVKLQPLVNQAFRTINFEEFRTPTTASSARYKKRDLSLDTMDTGRSNPLSASVQYDSLYQPTISISKGLSSLKNSIQFDRSMLTQKSGRTSRDNSSEISTSLDYDVKMKIIRQLIQLERIDRIAAEREERELAELEFQQKETDRFARERYVSKKKPIKLSAKQVEHFEKIVKVRAQVKEKLLMQERKRAQIRKEQIAEIRKSYEIEEQRLVEEEKIRYRRYIQYCEEKRALELQKIQRYEEDYQKAKECLEELEMDTQARNDKREELLDTRSRRIKNKLEQNQTKAYFLLEQKRHEEFENTSQNIGKIISEINQAKNHERNKKLNATVFDETRMNEARAYRKEADKKMQANLAEQYQNLMERTKKAGQTRNYTLAVQTEQIREQLNLDKQGHLENQAIVEYLDNLQSQSEINRYRSKFEIAKISKNIKEEITYLTSYGVKDIYESIKKDKRRMNSLGAFTQ